MFTISCSKIYDYQDVPALYVETETIFHNLNAELIRWFVSLLPVRPVAIQLKSETKLCRKMHKILWSLVLYTEKFVKYNRQERLIFCTCMQLIYKKKPFSILNRGLFITSGPKVRDVYCLVKCALCNKL